MERLRTLWLSIGIFVILIACDTLDAASTQRLFAAPETVERKCGYDVSIVDLLEKL